MLHSHHYFCFFFLAHFCGAPFAFTPFLILITQRRLQCDEKNLFIFLNFHDDEFFSFRFFLLRLRGGKKLTTYARPNEIKRKISCMQEREWKKLWITKKLKDFTPASFSFPLKKMKVIILHLATPSAYKRFHCYCDLERRIIYACKSVSLQITIESCKKKMLWWKRWAWTPQKLLFDEDYSFQ